MSQNSGMDSAKIVIASKAYTINKYKDLKHMYYNAMPKYILTNEV
jgi:hypothetical protein